MWTRPARRGASQGRPLRGLALASGSCPAVLPAGSFPPVPQRLRSQPSSSRPPFSVVDQVQSPVSTSLRNPSSCLSKGLIAEAGPSAQLCNGKKIPAREALWP